MPFCHFRKLLPPAIFAMACIPAFGQVAGKPFSAADIEIAQYTGGDLPPGRSALMAKIQVMLDRSGTSPGVIDGYHGGMSESAISAFERRARLPVDGVMDMQVWQLLLPYAAASQTMEYTITATDAEGLVAEIPTDYAEKAKMASMGYTSIGEKLGERFHMDEKFITYLNPGIPLAPGSTIKVAAPANPIKTKAMRIIVDKATRRVAVYDAVGDMITDYPATIGSDLTPSPSGVHKVVTVALNPNYTYNPAKNFKQGKNDKALIVPPGPNAPVGNVWIDLTKPSYGIHGTPTPSQLFRNQSYGCVRLTNWDAQELAGMVVAGKTTVEFLAPGVTIADVTTGPFKPGAVASIGQAAGGAITSSARPLPRPAHSGTFANAGQASTAAPAFNARPQAVLPNGSLAPQSLDAPNTSQPIIGNAGGADTAPDSSVIPAYDPLTEALSAAGARQSQ